MNTKHGFLAPYVAEDGFVSEISTTLWIGDLTYHQCSGPLAIENLVELAIQYRLTHLWIMPEYTEADTTEERARMESVTDEGRAIQANYDIRMFTNKYTGLVSSLVGRRKKPHTSNVNVIWLRQTRWHYENRKQFSALIDAVESQLGVPMKASPTSVGLRYLEKIDARHYREHFADPGLDKEWLRDTCREAAKPLIWCRMPTPEELTPRPELYLMAVDKRAAYPRASQEEKQGIGVPEVYQGEFNPRWPGFWDIAVEGLDQIDSRLPAPVWDNFTGRAVPTPIVKMLKSLGCAVYVEDALVWKESAHVFEKWARTLWQARLQVDDMKLVMNNTLGFTINGDDLADEKYRPDWHAAIVGGLRALMVYNACKVAGESGMYPIGCYIDCLYYLTPYRNSVPGLIQMPDSLGGYKMKWCLPVTDEVRALITSPEEQQHFNMMLNKLNTIAGGHE